MGGRTREGRAMTAHLTSRGMTPPWLTSVFEPDVMHDSLVPAPMACSLPGHSAAAARAREFTTAALGAWGLGALVDDVRLVVSELVTNAVRHAVPTAPHVGATPVQLRLIRQDYQIACVVRDPSEKPPVLTTPDDLAGDVDEDAAGQFGGDFPGGFAESGRGLLLVDALSLEWGWIVLHDTAFDAPDSGSGVGKAVWAVFALP
ncbi:ATP-binding protein [Streptosporangiaceae bacterium NEAU-GS5]|nr:ATP-binding protein [Streptosporangiaceae bacterium NEAU-GS5]